MKHTREREMKEVQVTELKIWNYTQCFAPRALLLLCGTEQRNTDCAVQLVVSRDITLALLWEMRASLATRARENVQCNAQYQFQQH